LFNNTLQEAGSQLTCIIKRTPVDQSGIPESTEKASSALPCLYSNNCIEASEISSDAADNLCNLLSPYHRKSAYTLAENVSALVRFVGLERLGFLTLTFPDNVSDPKEALKRFRSMNSNYLSPHPDFGKWLCVKERQKRGAWHYHLLIDCGSDIRTGIEWDEIKSGVYRSAGDHLRMLWADLRMNLKKYGFGRSELLPIRENGEAMAKYVGKYVSKHIGSRKEEDKGVRMVSYSQKWPRSNSAFQWHTPNSQRWRINVAAFAEFHGCFSMQALKERFGSRWAYHFADLIIGDNWPERLAEKKRKDNEISFSRISDSLPPPLYASTVEEAENRKSSGEQLNKCPDQDVPCPGLRSNSTIGEKNGRNATLYYQSGKVQQRKCDG